MEISVETKLSKSMKKFENRDVEITLSGAIDSKIEIKNFKYELEDGVLVILGNRESHVDIKLDDIERLYFESGENGYALLVLVLTYNLVVEFKTMAEKLIFFRDQIVEAMQKSGVLEEILKQEACNA